MNYRSQPLAFQAPHATPSLTLPTIILDRPAPNLPDTLASNVGQQQERHRGKLDVCAAAFWGAPHSFRSVRPGTVRLW